MKSCKGCLHFVVCKMVIGEPKLLHDDATKHTAERCITYKDRRRFVELPCPIGSTVYVIGHRYRAGCDECWINEGKFRPSDLEKIGERVFLTYEDAKAKVFSMNKGNSRFYFEGRYVGNA